jgi:hypothetical protein
LIAHSVGVSHLLLAWRRQMLKCSAEAFSPEGKPMAAKENAIAAKLKT